MSRHSYKTLAQTSTAIHKEKASKFIGISFPCESQEAFKKQLQVIQKEYQDAKHFCYAYKTLPDGSNFRVNDDGEPTNSAGKPILGQLDSFKITYCGCVVIRYFGGTKLGVGGLIKAFKEASKLTILNNTIINKEITAFYRIKFNYSQMNKVMSLIKRFQLKIINQELNLQSYILVECPIQQKEELENNLNSSFIQFETQED